MEVVIVLIIIFLLVIGAVKLLKTICRAVAAPFRGTSRTQSPDVTIQVVYGSGVQPSTRAPTKLDRDPSKYWNPKGTLVRVGSREIQGGMIYVGSKLGASRSEAGVEAALIDPQLKVSSSSGRQAGDMPYWPSYSRISPACRGAYLDWLAGGRSEPGIDVGFVFLFFYGLERRLLVDPMIIQVSPAEQHEIRSEVERLLSIYGSGGAFSNYAHAFLDLVGVLTTAAPLYNLEPPTLKRTFGLSITVRIAIAQLSRDGRPIPANWAFAWVWSDPNTSVRTPAQRCEDEMKQLFELRYYTVFGEGLTIKPNKRAVTIEYRPASPSVEFIAPATLGNLPDVTSLTGPIRKLRELFDACTDDLEPYSRWLGRNPDLRGSLQAVALLPAELTVPGSQGKAVNDLRQVLAEAVGSNQSGKVAPKAILDLWPPSKGLAYGKSDMIGIVQLLDKLGYGIEPDVRFHGPRLDQVDNLIAFRSAPQAPSAPTSEYLFVGLSLRLATAVAVADNMITDEERTALESHLASLSSMRPGDRERLEAHLQWLLLEKPTLTGLRKRLEGVAPAARSLLGQTLLAIAASDGLIEPGEIKTICKLYGQLGLDPEAVYSDLHALSFEENTATSGPVTVRPGEVVTGYRIDRPEGSGAAPSGARIVLDQKLIEAKMAEAQKAAALLAGIFGDDEPPVVEVPIAKAMSAAITGLDDKHAAMLIRLSVRDRWSMDEVDGIATELGLLAGGALETINDAAWQVTDQAVLEVSEFVAIDKSVFKEMSA